MLTKRLTANVSTVIALDALTSNITPYAAVILPDDELTSVKRSMEGISDTEGLYEGSWLTLGLNEGELDGESDGWLEIEGAELGFSDGIKLGALLGDPLGMLDKLG